VGEGKKKDPPGILDWLADFFVKPIATAIGELLEHHRDFIRTFVPITWLPDLLKKVAPAAETVDKSLAPEAITSPDEAAAAAPDLMKTLDLQLENVVDAILMLEAGSAGMVDISPARAVDLPPIKFLSTVSTALRETRFNSGFLPYYQRHVLSQYTPYLPPYQDMISVYVREGYMEEKWVEIPEEFTGFMKELGYSEEWTKRLWGKHWVLPDVHLLYQMFHKKIITYDAMTAMLKYHDFEPVWRDRLIANAYTMIPRVDLRRGYAWGMIPEAQLQERYEKLGYNVADAATMAGIAKRYGLTAYYTRVLNVAAASFRKGQLSGPSFQSIMELCGLPEEAQSMLLAAESMARAAAVTEPGEEPRVLSASQVCGAYAKGLLSLSAAKEQLLRMGYLEGDADLLLALATPKPQPEAPETEIVSAASLLYRNGWMTSQELAGWLRIAGLTDREIGVTRTAQDLREWLDYATDLLALWKQQFVKDIITSDEFYTNLLKWGCRPFRAEAIVQLEETRKVPLPKPPKPKLREILWNLYHGFISPSAAVAAMQELGYNKEDAEIIVSIFLGKGLPA